MTIKKYTGKTKEEAIALAKEELGESIVIMNTKDKKPDGVLGILKKSIWEVTVAIEEEDTKVPVRESLPTSTFSVSADEKIDLDFPDAPVSTAKKQAREAAARQPRTPAPAPEPAPVIPPIRKEPGKVPDVLAERGITEEALRETFEEINQLIDLDRIPSESISTANVRSSSPIIKKEDIEPKSPAPRPIQAAPAPADSAAPSKKNDNNLPLVRIIYSNLLDSEVDEKYINEILDDMGSIITGAGSLDLLIANIYQKMVLKLGAPITIDASGNEPTVVFFVGPTGVGKTTTIAKVASEFKLEHRKKVALITSDTYRIGATEQLNVYANILQVPIAVIYEPQEINQAVDSLRDADIILVDTVGFSHKNVEQKATTQALLDSLDSRFKKEIYLVLSATTKYKDLKEIADTYSQFCKYNIIFTKLDETNRYGSIFNIKLHTGASLSYITNGQTVPDDIEVADTQWLVKGLLGG